MPLGDWLASVPVGAGPPDQSSNSSFKLPENPPKSSRIASWLDSVGPSWEIPRRTAPPPTIEAMDQATPEGNKKIALQAKTDPGFKQKVLEQINAPVKTGSEINPEWTPPLSGQWWHNFFHNIKRPWEEASPGIHESWESPHWYGKPAAIGQAVWTAGFNVPAAVVPSAIMSSFGDSKHSSFRDLATQYAGTRQGTSLAPLVGLAALASVADVVSDPFTYLTAGAKPMYEAVEGLMQVPTMVAAKASDLAVDVIRRSRMAKEVTPQTLKDVLAPRLALENIARHGPEAEEGKAAIYHMLVDKKPLPSHGGRTFEQLKEEARKLSSKELRQHEGFPESLRAPAKEIPGQPKPVPKAFTPMQQAEDLAKHVVAIERSAWEGRPMLKAFGKAIGIPAAVAGEFKAVPNPFHFAGKQLGRIAGKWEQPTVPSASLASVDSVVPNFSRDAVAELGHYGITPETSLYDMENTWITSQMGPYAAKKRYRGISAPNSTEGPSNYQLYANNVTQQLVLHPKVIKNVVVSALESVAPQDRAMKLDRIINMYKGLAAMAEKEPVAILSRRARDYKRAADTLERMSGSSRQMAKIFKLRTKPAIEEALFQQAHDDIRMLETLFKQGNEQFAKEPLTGTTIPEAVKSFTDAVMVPKARITPEMNPLHKADVDKQIVDLLLRVHGSYNSLNAFNISYEAGTQFHQELKNLWGQIRKLEPDMLSMQATLKHVMGPGIMAKDARQNVWALVRSLATPGGKKVWSDLAASTQGTLSGGEFLEARNALNGMLHSLHRESKLSPLEFAEAKKVINEGNLTPESMSGLIRAMGELTHIRRFNDAQGAVFDHVLSPITRALREANHIAAQAMDKDYLNILSDMGQHQAMYTLREWVGKGLMQKTFNLIDQLRESSLTKARFGPGFFRLIEEQEFAHRNLDSDALAWSAKLAKGRKTLAERLAQRSYTDMEMHQIDEALGRVLGAEKGLYYSHPDVKWRMEVFNKAKALVKQGTDELTALMGPAATPMLDASRKNTWGLLKWMSDMEARTGQRVWAPHRFPVIDQLKPSSKGYVDNMIEKHEIFSTMQHKKPGQFMWQDPHFEGLADREAWLERMKALRERPIEYEMVYNLDALLAHRYQNYLKAQIQNQYSARLQGMLPSYAKFDIHPKLFPKNGPAGWVPITQLGGRFAKLEDAKHWYLPMPMLQYLKNNTASFSHADTLADLYMQISQRMYRLAVQLNLVHLKNIAALAFTARIDLAKVGKYLGYMLSHPQPVARSHILHPMDHFKYALDTHPLWREAMRQGLYHFDSELNKPMFVRALSQMGVKSKEGLLSKVQNVQGPFTTVVFDMLDRACRLAMYDSYKEMGIPGHLAAQFSNHYMIDYSAKFLAPRYRWWGHFLFPFFGWRIGNAMLHVPNMLQNPSMYALENEVRNQLNSDQEASLGLGDKDKWNKALSYMYATPFTYGGYSAWVNPQLPWYPYLKMKDDFMRNPAASPLSMPTDAITIMTNWLRLRQLLHSATNARVREEMIKNPGKFAKSLAEDELWGLRPFEHLGMAGVRKAQDPANVNLLQDIGWSAATMGIPVEKVTPAGKVYRDPGASGAVYEADPIQKISDRIFGGTSP